MLVPERHHTDTRYRYGFNGKEKDDEVKGSGNSYEYGARMYDPRVGRWSSVDKLDEKSPGWTPYRFSFDNPLQYIDEDGNFEIPIHKIITEASGKLNNLTQSQIKSLSRGAQNADYLGFAEDWHFDGRKNFEEIQAGWKVVNERMSKRGDDYYGLGSDLHNVQDFYSHSNYVELYVKYYKDQGGDMSKFTPDMVPLYEDGINIKGFKENYLEKELHTGDFCLTNNEKMPWTKKSSLGKHTHYQMNKDSNEALHGGEKVEGTDITYHELARDVATNATNKILRDKKEKEKEKETKKKKG